MSQPPDNSAIPEAGAANLRRAIGQLPAHAPDEQLWNSVAAQLATDEALARVVPALPAHEPDELLWNRIAARLDAAEPLAAAEPIKVARPAPAVGRTLQPGWRLRPARRAWALAASVLLVLGMSLWWGQRPGQSAASGPRETVAYSEEAAAEPGSFAEPLPAPAFDPLAQQGLAFIDAHCGSRPVLCGSGEFRSLRAQLTEIEAQQAQLRRDARRFGESPELRREQARLITLQARLTRELVHLLIT